MDLDEALDEPRHEVHFFDARTPSRKTPKNSFPRGRMFSPAMSLSLGIWAVPICPRLFQNLRSDLAVPAAPPAAARTQHCRGRARDRD